MAIQGLTQIQHALSSLNPKQIREASELPVRVSLHAPDVDAYASMESFLLSGLNEARRRESGMLIARSNQAGLAGSAKEIALYHAASNPPHGQLVFHPNDPESLVKKVLAQHNDAAIALSRHFKPFRESYVKSVIAATSRENTVFSITTALPDIIPSFIELPWAVAEFASDSAFLTMNQVRMAFQLAAASDREVGYLEQKSEIAAVIGSAFGWRALARQVIGKIPFGGGLIGKAAIAYAGTKVLGLSLDRYYSTGFAYGRDERKQLYSEAFEQGKRIAQKIFATIRPDLHAHPKSSAAGTGSN